MFADAASWCRPIRFRGGVGGHVAVLDTAQRARRQGVRRLALVASGALRFARLRPPLPYGEVGREGSEYMLGPSADRSQADPRTPYSDPRRPKRDTRSGTFASPAGHVRPRGSVERRLRASYARAVHRDVIDCDRAVPFDVSAR